MQCSNETGPSRTARSNVGVNPDAANDAIQVFGRNRTQSVRHDASRDSGDIS